MRPVTVLDESDTCLLNDKVEPVTRNDKSYISDYESYRDSFLFHCSLLMCR